MLQYSWLKHPAFFYCNVILFFFLINGIFGRASCHLDLSRDKVNSVSDSTAQVFTALNEPVLLEAYISREVTGEISSEILPILSILREMERVSNDKLKLRVYDPNTEELRRKAQERGINGVPIAQQKDIETSVRLGYFGLYLQQGDDSTVVPLIGRNWFVKDLEYRVLREIKRFSRSEESSGIALAKAEGAFQVRAWTQHQDQTKDNLYGFKSTMERELGKIEELELNEPIPIKVETVILVGLPKLEPKQSYYLDQFLLRGGNLICMFGSFQFEIQQGNPRFARLGLSAGGHIGPANVAKEDLEKLNQWLSKYGITLKGEILLEPSQSMPVWDFSGGFPMRIPYPAWAVYTRQATNVIGEHPALAAIGQLVFPWFSSLDIKQAKQPGLTFETLVQTSSSAVSLPFANLGYREVNSMGKNPKEYLGYRAATAVLASGKFKSVYLQKDIPKGADKALHLENQAGETKANLVVIATPYLVSDIMFRNQSGTRIFRLNSAFILNLMEAVEGDTDLLEARSRQRTLSRLIVESNWLKSFISWSFGLVLPFVLSLLGAFRLARRNRKRGLEDIDKRSQK